MNINRGETNSCELYGNVVFCDTDMRNHNLNCDTVVRETNINYQTLPHAGSHSHHFHSLHFTFPQDGVLLRVLPGGQIIFYALDIMYIHEVDNFQIYINVLNNQHGYVNGWQGAQPTKTFTWASPKSSLTSLEEIGRASCRERC